MMDGESIFVVPIREHVNNKWNTLKPLFGPRGFDKYLLIILEWAPSILFHSDATRGRARGILILSKIMTNSSNSALETEVESNNKTNDSFNHHAPWHFNPKTPSERPQIANTTIFFIFLRFKNRGIWNFVFWWRRRRLTFYRIIGLITIHFRRRPLAKVIVFLK